MVSVPLFRALTFDDMCVILNEKENTMSEMEYHMGKMIKMMGFDGLSREGVYERLCRLEGFTHLPEYYEWEDIFYGNDLFDKYVVTDKEVYKCLEHKEMNESHCSLQRNDDGTIDFYISFYNAGGSFNEVIEDELKLLDKEKDE